MYYTLTHSRFLASRHYKRKLHSVASILIEIKLIMPKKDQNPNKYFCPADCIQLQHLLTFAPILVMQLASAKTTFTSKKEKPNDISRTDYGRSVREFASTSVRFVYAMWLTTRYLLKISHPH